MSKILDKIKDAMTGQKSRSKRASHGSDSSGYDEDSGSFGGPRSDSGPYRHEDYGSRFGSYGNKLRPGTYGSGEHGSSTRLDQVPYSNNVAARSTGRVQSSTANGYGSSSQNDTSSSYSSARTAQSFEGNTAGSGSLHRPVRHQRGGSYRVQL
ncbi:uncharacterized protein BDV14DRAFT_154355 [Aspergillus stella-maris]|uniref:uncharacterized protein n=1 Tax=Aspergillus stella-maris TaxID=1810926 RepID=UPI003CCD75C3